MTQKESNLSSNSKTIAVGSANVDEILARVVNMQSPYGIGPKHMLQLERKCLEKAIEIVEELAEEVSSVLDLWMADNQTGPSENVLANPIGTTVYYTIGDIGTWSDPIIETIEDDPALDKMDEDSVVTVANEIRSRTLHSINDGWSDPHAHLRGKIVQRG
jgi:hypothetical protein